MTSLFQVAVATDRRYLPWCSTAILSSLRASPGRNVHFHVLHDASVGTTARDALSRMAAAQGGTATCHRVPRRHLAGLPSKGRHMGRRISWARILLPDLLPSTDRILYLDADTLSRRSLDSLWSVDLSGRHLAAVANVVEPAMRQHVASLDLADPSRYFNAGVLLMDLASMREERLYQKVLEWSRRSGRTHWYDQDALNVLYSGRWLELEPEWNAQNSLWGWREWADGVFGQSAADQARSDPAILHFEGPALVKPWNPSSTHPYRDDYLAVLAMTPWARMASPSSRRRWGRPPVYPVREPR